MIPGDILEALKKVPEFASVPENQLKWLIEKGETASYPDGTKIFRSGDVVEELRIILKGEMSIYREQAGSIKNIGTFGVGEITGILPYSRMKAVFAEGQVSGETILFGLHKRHFHEMIVQHYELTESLVHAMTDRVRDFTKQQQQDDKIMALGKLSAGLAHELNNPSAAVVRTAVALKKHLSHVPEKFKAVIKIQTSDEVVDLVNDLVFSKIAENGKQTLSLMQKTQLEDSIVSWMSLHGIEDSYEIAETYAAFHITPDDLEKLDPLLRTADKAAVFDWINQVLTTERLVSEIQEASRRINALVSSIKSYTHMDLAPEKHRTDIHTGIQNTLTLLNHKVKHNQVKLVLNFAQDLPQANVFVSELNQVWTNLIDNALDAMEGRPDSTLEIRTQRHKEFILIYIVDNGPGIPEDIKDKIFDPFFTTKPVGRGTGLGLEVVRQIINQHTGKIDLNSVPGRTEFKVCIPIG
jgi:signal transduction histidine kinase